MGDKRWKMGGERSAVGGQKSAGEAVIAKSKRRTEHTEYME